MTEPIKDLDGTAIPATTYREMLQQALRDDSSLPKLALESVGDTARRVIIHITFTAEIPAPWVLQEAEAIGMLPPALAEKWRAK